MCKFFVVELESAEKYIYYLIFTFFFIKKKFDFFCHFLREKNAIFFKYFFLRKTNHFQKGLLVVSGMWDFLYFVSRFCFISIEFMCVACQNSNIG